MYFGRAAIRISTGKLIEFQSGDAPLGALRGNAIASGVPAEDIEEKYINYEEFKILMSVLPQVIREKSDIEKLVEYAKVQKWI